MITYNSISGVPVLANLLQNFNNKNKQKYLI